MHSGTFSYWVRDAYLVRVGLVSAELARSECELS
jgi:hypothetical protein